MDSRSLSHAPLRPIVVVLGVLVGALAAVLLAPAGVDPPEHAEPAGAVHPLWSDMPTAPESVASGPTHVLEPELHSIHSEHGVHAGIMAF